VKELKRKANRNIKQNKNIYQVKN